MEIILASKSPRRNEILKKAGYECDVIVVVSSGEKCAVDKELIGKNVTTHDTVMTLFPK